MNLKEAFRFQNKLQAVLDEATQVLASDQNVTKTVNTHLRKKVMPEAENETVENMQTTDWADRITELAAFTLYLLEEKEKLFRAVRLAKNAQTIDIDSETSLNSARQHVASVLSHMADLRASELVIANGGFGYRFNTDGNQVTYKCDVKRVTTINFDRGKVRGWAKALNAKSDAVSADIDRCVVNAEVDYAAPFDVNGSFADIFEGWLEAQAS